MMPEGGKLFLAIEFQFSSRPHKMLRNLVLTTQRKMDVVYLAINNKTARILSNSGTGYSVRRTPYLTIKNASVQEAARDEAV
jgi:hypothetical protein